MVKKNYLLIGLFVVRLCLSAESMSIKRTRSYQELSHAAAFYEEKSTAKSDSIWQRMVACLAGFCCDRRSKSLTYELHQPRVPLSESNQILESFRSPKGGALLNRLLLQAVRSEQVDCSDIEDLILEGADPFASVYEESAFAQNPIISLVRSLSDGRQASGRRCYLLYTVLSAYERRSKSVDDSESIPARRKAVREIAARLFAEFGQAQEIDAFEKNGRLWSEICALLGADMVCLRSEAYSLLKKKRNGLNDYLILKKAQMEQTLFRRFSRACAVVDFIYCVASTLAGTEIYNIVALCKTGHMIVVEGPDIDMYKADAQRLMLLLNQDAYTRVDHMIKVLRDE